MGIPSGILPTSGRSYYDRYAVSIHTYQINDNFFCILFLLDELENF